MGYDVLTLPDSNLLDLGLQVAQQGFQALQKHSGIQHRSSNLTGDGRNRAQLCGCDTREDDDDERLWHVL
jgi:hypothetical protein